MGESSDEFRQTLIELVDTTRPEPVEHPSPDRWLAYQRGELAAGDEATLLDHLVRCRDCFDLAQAAAAFVEPTAATETTAGSADGGDPALAEWRLLRQRLATLEPSGATPIPATTHLAPPRLARGRRYPYALAAALFLALVGSAAWNLQQQRALAALRAPRPNAPIFDFSAGERRAPGERSLAAGSGPWMLVFHPSEELPAYRLAIRDAATGRVLSSHELRPDADLALTLDLPEGLPAGRYRLELSAAGRLLEELRLRVTEAGGGH